MIPEFWGAGHARKTSLVYIVKAHNEALNRWASWLVMHTGVPRGCAYEDTEVWCVRPSRRPSDALLLWLVQICVLCDKTAIMSILLSWALWIKPSNLRWMVGTYVCVEGSLVAQWWRACQAGDSGSIPGLGRSPEKEIATHSSNLARRIPWTEEPGGLQSMGSQGVGRDLATEQDTCSHLVRSTGCLEFPGLVAGVWDEDSLTKWK